MYIGFSWECQGGLRVLARSDTHIFTPFLADENDLFHFQAEKRQQVSVWNWSEIAFFGEWT